VLAAATLAGAGTADGSVAPSAGAQPAGAPDCAPVRAQDFLPSAGVAQPDAVVRVHAIQMKQEIRHVETYDTFARKVRCLFADLVRPELAADLPDLVIYPEYAGLATLGTGSRGAPARAIAEGPTRGHPETWQDAPGAVQAFGTLAATYADEQAHYRTVLAARQAVEDPEAAEDPERSFAAADPRRMILVATTDTVARAYLGPFSRLARDEGVFVVSSAALPELRRSGDPQDVAALADPDLEGVEEVWVAADARVWNEVHVWAPEPGQTEWSRERYGELETDDPRSNLVHINRKAPTTPIEEDFLALTEGDMSRQNTGPFTLDGVPGLRFSVANSLPAFMWGTREPGGYAADFGEPVPPEQDPCADPEWWVRCLDARGTNVIIQTEANPAPWAEYSDPFENWQPLVWMESSWRHAADPTVAFRYTITPWLVGNLVDIPFDGQANIKRRANPRPYEVRHFVGAGEHVGAQDPATTELFAGPKDEFLVTAPWVLEEDPSLDTASDRERLRERAQAMLAGSDSEHENRYLETAVWADLTAPPARSDPDEPDARDPHEAADGDERRSETVVPGPAGAGAPLPATGAGPGAAGPLVLAAVSLLLLRRRRRSGPA
jgi:hypothetical protein